MSPPYPTAAEIKAIFELENGPNSDREKHLSHFDEEFVARAVSDSCPFPRRVDKTGYGQVLEMQEQWMHPDHHYHKHVGIVTGGENNEWAAVELFNTGKTQADQDYKGQFLVLIRFTRERKIIEMKVFLDSPELHVTKSHVDSDKLPRHAMDSPVQ